MNRFEAWQGIYKLPAWFIRYGRELARTVNVIREAGLGECFVRLCVGVYASYLMLVVYLSYYLLTTRLFLLVLRESLHPDLLHVACRPTLRQHTPSLPRLATRRFKTAIHVVLSMTTCTRVVFANYCDFDVWTFMMFDCGAKSPYYSC